MDDKRYSIITNGKPAKGRDPEEVLRRLSALFKSPPEKVRKLLSGKIATVRRGLDEQTARRMFSALRQAGLTCKVQQEAVQIRSESATGVSPDKAGAPDVRAATGARSIDPEMASTSVEHTAMNSGEITPSEAGIDFHKPGSRNIPYSSILLLAVYEIPSSLGGEIRLMAFVSSSHRPLVLSATSIKYWQFEGISSKSTGVSLRQFIAHVYAQNPSLILDAPTVKFLDGGLPRLLEVDESIMASALGRALTAEGLFVEARAAEAEAGTDISEMLMKIKRAGTRETKKGVMVRTLIALLATALSGAWGLWTLWGQLSFLRLYSSYFEGGNNPVINHLLMWTSVILLVIMVTYAGVVFNRILGKDPEAKESLRLLAWLTGSLSAIRFVLLWGLTAGLRRGMVGGGFALADMAPVLKSKRIVLDALIMSPAGIAIPLMIIAVRLYSRSPGTIKRGG